MDLEIGNITFDLPKNQSNVIKVIGVGGGGSNAINHMFKQGIKGVDFVICNTDSQALQNSTVPNKIQLGMSLTEGLGAGANPDVGQQSALESIEDIEKMLDTNTKMVFITAGMGGGTGTGAAPVIAQLAKEKDILTVGIVTIPFGFEGKVRLEQAMNGVERLRKQVDSLIVINNNKLREVYGNLGFKAGFSKADEVLATAARGIAEVITHHYTQNIDLKDAKTVLNNSGTAIMGSAVSRGEDRAKNAIVEALDSPLLNDNKIAGAKNVLLLIVSGSEEITIDEIGEINDYIQAEAGYNANIIMGVGEDEKLDDAISVTIIATGFNIDQQQEIVNAQPSKIIHSLQDEQTQSFELLNKKPVIDQFKNINEPLNPEQSSEEKKIVYDLETFEIEVQKPIIIESDENQLIETNSEIKKIDVEFEIVCANFENDLVNTTNEIREIFVNDPKYVVIEKVKSNHEQPLLFDLTDDIKEIKVNEHIEFIPYAEVQQNEVIKHSLEEYMMVEEALINSKPIHPEKETLKIDEALQISLKTSIAPSLDSQENRVEVDPSEMTIDETLRLKAEERKLKLKTFNYQFSTNAARIDDLEKEPAYKRLGIDLNENKGSSLSNTSLSLDSNNNNQLRNGNSYLHDNVD
jgi:cell division protein FtsZ